MAERARIAQADIQQQPSQYDAEIQVIGSCLIDSDGILKAMDAGLQPDHFMGHVNRLIYSAMADLFKHGKGIDVVMVCDKLDTTVNDQGDHALDVVGGASEVTAFILQIVSSVHVQYYAELVMRAWQQRRMINFAAQAASLAHSWEGSPNELTVETQQLLAELFLDNEGGAEIETGDEYLMQFLEEQQHIRDHLKENPGSWLQAGFPELDKILGQVARRKLLLALAPTSTGKTMLMECIAEHNAKRGNVVLMYTTELTHQDLRYRQICRYSTANFAALEKGLASDRGVPAALDEIRSWPGKIHYVYCPGWSIDQINVDIRKHAMRGQVDMAMVDYLQMVPTESNFIAHELGKIAGDFKITCAQHNIAGVMTSQVRRTEGDKRPTLDDLRNSGEPCERANQILILHRKDKGERRGGQASEPITCYVDKNSNMPLGQVQLRHVLGRFRLEEVGKVGSMSDNEMRDYTQSDRDDLLDAFEPRQSTRKRLD